MKSFVSAVDLVNDLTLADKIKGKYCIIFDQSMKGIKLENLSEAINLMVEYNWRCMNITYGKGVKALIVGESVYVYALMERVE